MNGDKKKPVDLDEEYRQMAEDEESEAEALEWAEDLIGETLKSTKDESHEE